jgi:hypothetical protein
MDTKETQKTNQAAGGEKKNGLCRIVTKKRLGGLAAVIVIALIAGAGWNAYHHQKHGRHAPAGARRPLADEYHPGREARAEPALRGPGQERCGRGHRPGRLRHQL